MKKNLLALLLVLILSAMSVIGLAGCSPPPAINDSHQPRSLADRVRKDAGLDAGLIPG